MIFDNLIIFGGASGTGMSQGRTLSTQYNVVEIEIEESGRSVVPKKS